VADAALTRPAALGRDERDLAFALDDEVLDEQRAFVGAVD
jgi:hypothetical protein